MKNRVFFIIILMSLALSSSACDNQNYNKSKERILKIETNYGDIIIKLYNETPLHRDNFIKLVESGFYDDILFHRIIKDFMIQTGDPDSKGASEGQALGFGGPGYTVPAEINSAFIHKKGALAAARMGDNVNPEQESSGSQFYIVVGKVLTDAQIDATEKNINNTLKKKLYKDIVQEEFSKIDADTITQEQQQEIYNNAKILTNLKFAEIGEFTYSEEQKEYYKTLGGTPHLDGGYSVFGEVIEGLDVVEKIALAKTSQRSNRPIEDIKIRITIIK